MGNTHPQNFFNKINSFKTGTCENLDLRNISTMVIFKSNMMWEDVTLKMGVELVWALTAPLEHPASHIIIPKTMNQVRIISVDKSCHWKDYRQIGDMNTDVSDDSVCCCKVRGYAARSKFGGCGDHEWAWQI